MIINTALSPSRAAALPGSRNACKDIAIELGEQSYMLRDLILAPGYKQVIECAEAGEVIYCLRGEGKLTDLATGNVTPVMPNVVYLIEQSDRMSLAVGSGVMHLIEIIQSTLSPEQPAGEDGETTPYSLLRESV